MKPIEVILATFNFFAAILISQVIRLQIVDFSFFSLNKDLALITIFSQILIGVLYGLSSPGWHAKNRYFLTILPVALGFGVGLISILSPLYLIVFLGLFSLLGAIELRAARKIMDKLVKPDVLTISRTSVRVILFSISILSALTLTFNTSAQDKAEVKEDVAEYVTTNIVPEEEVVPEPAALNNVGGLREMIKNSWSTIINQNREVGVNLVENEISNLLSVYDYLIKPIMGLAIFGMFELYATVAFFIYKLLIGPIFKMLLAGGWISIRMEEVTREIPSF